MEKLREYAAEFEISLTDAMLEQFVKYRELLLEWNKKFNLTAITDEEEIIAKHFLDSLVLGTVVDLEEDMKVLDVGTGAGFPGVPLKIVFPDIQLTLLDSLQKRVTFLEELSRVLHQSNCCVHGRAEELAREADWREGFQLVTARAVANLPSLCEYCMPLVAVGGSFVAMKGPNAQKEVEAAERAIEVLGGELTEFQELTLPGENSRTLIVIEKISHTPTKYPRKGVRITKSPLTK